MVAKLALALEDEVIKKAKEFARQNHTSLSQITEDYFRTLTQMSGKTEKEIEISPLVKRLSGVLQLPDQFNLKEERKKELTRKFS